MRNLTDADDSEPDGSVMAHEDSASVDRPRIALATTVYDHTDVGGGTFIHYLRRAVEKGQLDLTFYSDDMANPGARFERRVSIPSGVARLPGAWITRSYYLHQAILHEHAERPFDIIWHNNVITSLVSVVRGVDVPIVGMINDYNNAESLTPTATRDKFGGYRAFVRFGWHQLERYAARRVDHVVVNSSYMADVIGRTYKIERPRIRLLYKGVDLDQFKFAPPAAFGDTVKVLFVKQDFVRGGLWELLEAMSEFPVKLKLSIVGPPPTAFTQIRAAAVAAGCADSIHLSGPIGRSEIAGYFRSHDVLCIPSRSEALGVAFMEALASGVPAIGTRVGGIPEVLDNGRAGWMAEPRNAESVRRMLLDVIMNNEMREERVTHGRAHVERFSEDTMVREFMAIGDSIRRKVEGPAR